ncbi:MAG: hypothetical protein Kow0022_06540 [Phycisphaerales bacterium]
MALRISKTGMLVAASAWVLGGGAAWADLPTAGEILDHGRLVNLAIGEPVVLDEFPLADAGRFALDVSRFSVLTPDAQVVAGTPEGMVPIPDTGLVLLRGKVVGHDEDSTVFIAVGQWGINGFVSLNDEFFSITTGPYHGPIQPGEQVFVTSNFNLPDTMDSFCQYDPNDPKLNPDRGAIEQADEQPLFDARGTGCNLAIIAVDSDYEFTSRLFGGNISASADYAQTLLGAASTIYERDVNVTISVGFLRVWSSNTDPYGSGDLGAFLDDVRAEWRANMGSVSRVIVHGLSGRNLGGGVAWLNALCSTNLGYGVSSSLNGSFPYPLQDHNSANWDIIVVPHEMGHNFGSGHTHDGYNPPIDGCGNGNCTGAWGGTIMSYCHLCSGGIRNIVLQFHPRVQAVIESRVASAGCISTTGNAFATQDDSALTIQGLPVTIDVLTNDAAISCGTPSIIGVQSPTPNGGTVSIINGSPMDQLQYTPAAGFSGVDTFTYTITDNVTGNVSVNVQALRQPDNPANPQPGVQVSYYLLNNPTSLPDFDTLTPYLSDVLPNINYPSTTGIFATSALANNVGAVFDGYVQVNLPGLYTFEVESSDGVELWIGDQLVVSNDGVHDVETASGQIALLSGLHQIHIEFFEASGNAALIVRNTLSGGTPQVIPASAWFYTTEQPCQADFNSDGELNFFDVQAFLAALAAHDASADVNNDNTWDFFDAQAFLSLFAAGCP